MGKSAAMTPGLGIRMRGRTAEAMLTPPSSVMRDTG